MKLNAPPITPGDWNVHPMSGNLVDTSVGGSCHRTIAKPPQDSPEDRANTRAIASVPALLAALETIHANAAESVEWIRRHTTAALTAAGYTVAE